MFVQEKSIWKKNGLCYMMIVSLLPAPSGMRSKSIKCSKHILILLHTHFIRSMIVCCKLRVIVHFWLLFPYNQFIFGKFQQVYFEGLVQDCSNSSVLAMELLQSCTESSIWKSEVHGKSIFNFIAPHAIRLGYCWDKLSSLGHDDGCRYPGTK